MTTEAEVALALPSAEMIQKITEFANAVAWKKPNLDVLQAKYGGQYPPIAEAMQRHIKLSDWRKQLVLLDLRAFDNQTVAVFTDYGGESKEAKYLTYSTLVCGWNLTYEFLEMMKFVRQQHGLGCDLVLQWLAHDGFGLKKMNLIMRPGENGAIEAATLEFDLKDVPDDPTFIPIRV